MHVSDVPINCINRAAIEYHVPAKLIISVLEVEQGQIGSISKNKNGTYDIGPMQINSSWLDLLNKRGISRNDIQYNPCINIEVGTWLLAKSITSSDNFSKGIGNYNSHTFKLNKKYYKKVYSKSVALNKILTKE